MRDRLNREKHPFFEFSEAEYFLAERGGRVVGRIAAIVNRRHNEFHRDQVGFFGCFESENDQAVADALFAAADRWLRERGCDTMRGPVSLSQNDESGLLVDGFETPPTIMMPHNPRSYPVLFERAGLAGVKNLYVYTGGAPDHFVPIPDRLRRATQMLAKRYEITLRSLNMKRWDDELQTIKQIYNAAWEANWGFVPMTDREIDHLAAQLKPVVVPELIPFAEREGKVVGFGVTLPDLNSGLVGFNGSILGALKGLWMLKTKRIRRARIPLLGILPEVRGKGVDAMLYDWIWEKCGARQIYWGEAGWILEDNAAMNLALEKMTFRVYKTYRMYERPL
jgi:GNAT superfamily N-acetyltransferase